MRWLKVLGLAAFAGVAATGVVIARDQRRRNAYTPDEVRTGCTPGSPKPRNPPKPRHPPNPPRPPTTARDHRRLDAASVRGVPGRPDVRLPAPLVARPAGRRPGSPR